MPYDEWLNLAALRAYFPSVDDRTIRRRLARWRADGFPAVRSQTRAVGGVEFAVRVVELEAHLGLRRAA